MLALGSVFGFYAAALAAYDIVSLDFVTDDHVQYRATCEDGYEFTVLYDSTQETYRLPLGEVHPTFDIAASRACGRLQQTVPVDYMAAGSTGG